MLNDFFDETEIPLDWETFQSLPRHPAFRYEYANGRARISGNPRYYHCTLPFPEDSHTVVAEPPGTAVSCFYSEFELRPLDAEDWGQLPALFASAFRKSIPFTAMTEDQRLVAAASLLKRTQSGEDGPLVPKASCLLIDRTTAELRAALLITLVPNGDLQDFTSDQWQMTAPPDALETGWGQPHLTWVFVAADFQRRNLATALLREATSQLKRRGNSQLVSTFLLGDHISTLWHWRMGFQLMGHPGSRKHLITEP